MASKQTDAIEILLAVDNDQAGKLFIETFNVSFLKVDSAQPTLVTSELKADWNELLKETKKTEKEIKQMKGRGLTKMKKNPSQTVNELIKKKDYSGLSEHLKDGIASYLQGDTFKNYLDFVSNFYRYSSKNIQLLLAQQPNATHVAGFKKWKQLDRHVKKGEKALYIYAPCSRKKKDKEGNPVVDSNGRIETETYFYLQPVFDVNQTEGKELPKPVYAIEDDLKDPKLFSHMYQSFVDLSPVPVSQLNH